MRAGLERLDAVEAHAGWSAPHDYVAVFEQDAFRFLGALQAAQQEDAFESEVYRDDGLRHVAFVAVLVQSELGAGLVAIDVQCVGAEVREAGADGTAESEVMQDAWHGWPHADMFRIVRVPPVCECSRSTAIGDHHPHRQAARSNGVVQRRRSENLPYRGEELTVVGHGQAPHEYSAGEDFLMRWFGLELGEKVHR